MSGYGTSRHFATMQNLVYRVIADIEQATPMSAKVAPSPRELGFVASVSYGGLWWLLLLIKLAP